MISLVVTDDDDECFVRLASRLVNGAVSGCGFSHAFVVKIDNWFGKRWLSFAGKVCGAMGVRRLGDRLVIPPFHPSRIVAQQSFVLGGDDTWAAATDPPQIHIEQASSDNMQRLVRVHHPNAALFWWSARTAVNDRGAVMAYLPSAGDHEGWYVEARADRSWSGSDFVCITPVEVDHLLARGGPAN